MSIPENQGAFRIEWPRETLYVRVLSRLLSTNQDLEKGSALPWTQSTVCPGTGQEGTPGIKQQRCVHTNVCALLLT